MALKNKETSQKSSTDTESGATIDHGETSTTNSNKKKGNNKKKQHNNNNNNSNTNNNNSTNVTITNGHHVDPVTVTIDEKEAIQVSTETTDQQTDNKDAIDKSETLLDGSDYDGSQENESTVTIISPGAEPLNIKLSSMELVQEIHQLLMDREDTCHRTCFSLQLDGVTLDNFAELKNFEGLKDGSIIKVVEEPYTMREARIHVRHVRDILKSLDPSDAYNGIDCGSLTFLQQITGGDLLEKKKTRPDSVDCTPPDHIMPWAKERPVLPLQPGIKNNKTPQPLKILTTSAWNPPPGPRKLHGDLIYLYVVTLEDKRFHISACPRGFYINQSTDEVFNPKPETPCHLSHSLIDLLSQVSPTFKRYFNQMQKKRTQRHPFERVATPYQVYSWCSPSLDHTIDAIRAEDTFSSKLGYEEHIPGQTREWNEELQSTRELPRGKLPERLLRERAIFKVHSDFVTAATRGAMAVIDGSVMAINPGEDSKMQMFIWNNIFFSLGFDVREHYKELGGDAAAFIAPRNDLHGVRVYSAVDVEGLYTLGTVVIDYRGYRVTAQSIIPGILEREQEQSVVYGSIDFGKTILSHPKYLELLNKAGNHLKILPHSVLNDKNEVIELCSSVECKGIIGNDGRYYILDLLRTFPPDVNFLKLDDVTLSNEVKSMGFPIEHKHKLCCLRQELLEAFIVDRYDMFVNHAAFHLKQANIIRLKTPAAPVKIEPIQSKEEVEATKISEAKPDEVKKVEDSTVTEKNSEKEVDKKMDETKKIMETISDSLHIDEKQTLLSKEVVKKASQAVGSLKDYEFDIRFNPDVFSPGIRIVDEPDSANSLKKQKKLVQDAAEFLLLHQIPSFVNECLDHTSAPMDGVTLSEALHNHGINIRYLGKVTQLLSKTKQLEYLHTIAVSELILRAAKHIFTQYLQNTETMNLSSAISHFLNCFLTSSIYNVTAPQYGLDELHKTTTGSNSNRRNKKTTNANATNGRRNLKYPLSTSDTNNLEWLQLAQKSLWSQIKKELKSYWDFDLPTDTVDEVCEQYKIQKISLLRSFCLKVGLQILLREYNFEPKNKQTFNDDDILNVFPVVKHIKPRATDAYNFYSTGQNKIQQGKFKDGFELISEALNLLNNVYGAMHPENAQCLRMLARLSYIMGDSQEALAIQQRAVLMSERVNGIDHPYTIMEYAHLALYAFANSQISTALKLLYRARYLALIVCGENHPDIALFDSNISLILHAVGEYELSLRFLEHALALNIIYYGEKSLKVAVSYHLVARTQSCMGDFRSALNHEKETFAIYKQQLGENHDKTKESSECLRHLTHQAVVLQKKMNDIYTNGKLSTGLPPIHIQPPSMGSVLDMLNAINGILFVQITSKEIENLKNEMEKRQKELDSSSSVTTVDSGNQEILEKIILSNIITEDEGEGEENKAKVNGDVLDSNKTSVEIKQETTISSS